MRSNCLLTNLKLFCWASFHNPHEAGGRFTSPTGRASFLMTSTLAGEEPDLARRERLASFVGAHCGRRIACVTSGGTTVPLERNTVRYDPPLAEKDFRPLTHWPNLLLICAVLRVLSIHVQVHRQLLDW
jgi:hypothetical protein